MKRYKIEFYYAFMSLLFTLQSLSLIDNKGDQTWFADAARQINFDYIGFAIDRYNNWSSRLLIESSTMFFSIHQKLFGTVLLLSTFTFLLVSRKLFIKSQSEITTFSLPIVMFLIFPSFLFTSAGLVATVTNYYFPMVTLVIAWYFVSKKQLGYLIFALPFWLHTVMQEQFAVFGFFLFLYLTIQNYISNRKIQINYFSLYIISILGIVSAALSPGSAIRSKTEIQNWYPNFEQVSIVNKVFLGFVDTNRGILLGDAMVFLYIILLIMVGINALKKNIYPFLISLGLFLLLTFHKLQLMTNLRVFSEIAGEVNEMSMDIKTVSILFFMTTILLTLAYLIWNSFKTLGEKVFPLMLLIIGYISRMLVSFSPTIYASLERTYIPLVFSGFIVTILLLIEIEKLWSHKKRKVQALNN
ncbi:TPA: hypothetical protein U2B30_001783 [Streptococcus suis]|nr:hypothetical protein [Streptococcus suis]